jgi:formyltetrahydrofolate-dependent phosphoribosylglycinamide formyltransferase
MSPARIVVLASGAGTNLQALLDATRLPDPAARLDAEVVGVYSHAASALALRRAERHGIPHHFVPLPGKKGSRDAWDRDLAARIHAECDPVDLIAMLGWTRVMSPDFLAAFACPVLNLHPSLPGDLVGLDAIERAFDEYEAGRRDSAGVMVHRVVPEIDAGPVVVSEALPMPPGLTFDAFAEAMHALEHRLVVEAARRILFTTK